jgi:hypothetical protein
MTDKPSRPSRLPIFFSVSALALSLVSAYLGFQTQRDAAQKAAIRDTYDTFKDLDRLHMDRWQQSHLLTERDDYARVVALVRTAAPAGSVERAAWTLQEEGLADYMFDTFEHALLQYNQAVKAGDPGRIEITQAVVDYFTSRVLPNPRLLYFWTVGGQSRHFDAAIVDYVKVKVLNGKDAPDEAQIDRKGPLAE